MNTIFVDLDGVLCDFVSAAMGIHGVWSDQDLSRSLYDVCGVTEAAFWKNISGYGADFWSGLRPYPWKISLLREIQAVSGGNWFVATSPSQDPLCAAGKLQWMQRHLCEYGRNGYFGNFHIGHSKRLLAGPGRILIDDNERQCEEFYKAGGAAILFPQPWNMHRNETDPVAFVRQQLSVLIGETADSAAE